MKFAIGALIASAASAMDLRSKFMDYLVQHGKSYLTIEEFNARLDLFSETDQFIEEHNATESDFTVGHNKFSDMTEYEKAGYRGLIPEDYEMGIREPVILSTDSLPSSIDWRSKGAVNKIQD